MFDLLARFFRFIISTKEEMKEAFGVADSRKLWTSSERGQQRIKEREDQIAEQKRQEEQNERRR